MTRTPATRRHSSWSLTPLTVASVSFLALVVVAFLPASHGWDDAVTAWLQRAAPGPDVPAAWLVLLGNAEVMIPATGLAGCWLLRTDRTVGHALLGLAVRTLGVSLLALGLKYAIPHQGPLPALHRQVLSTGLSLQEPFSLPSGHAARTTLLAGTLLRRRPILAGAVVLAMMTALVYLGEHWMIDVLAGLCLGWVFLEATRRWRWSS